MAIPQQIVAGDPVPVTSTATAPAATVAAAQVQPLGTRIMVTVYNAATTALLVLIQNTPTIAQISSTNFSVKLAAGTGYYETPLGYSGPVWLLWEGSPTGVAMVQELRDC